MSIMNRARTSVGVTLEQSKSTALSVSGRAAALPAGTRDLARNAIALARRQAYATMGAGDVIVATVTRQRAELPAQAKELVGSLRKVTPSVTATRVKSSTQGRADEAKDAYEKLTARGEQVAADLRHDPVLVRIIRDVDTRVENAANAVTSVAQRVRARALAQAKREGAATTSTPVRVTPANKVPAHRTTVRKTRAAEATISTTPTHRAAAAETANRQAAAKKAAATRKAAAEQAAATRKAAAKKAAATRKAAAAEAEAKRKATAKKAAATRKKNAASV